MKRPMLAISALSLIAFTLGHAVQGSEPAPPRELAHTPGTLLRVLSDDIAPLATRFNAAARRTRFLAILSPT